MSNSICKDFYFAVFINDNNINALNNDKKLMVKFGA